MNYHIIDEKYQYEAIGLHGFYYKLFEEEENGGTRERLDGYHYLKYLIQLFSGYWVKNMAKMNEAVGMNDCLKTNGGGKWIVCPFISKYFWKCIGCVLSTVAYWKKGHNLCSEIKKIFW